MDGRSPAGVAFELLDVPGNAPGGCWELVEGPDSAAGNGLPKRCPEPSNAANRLGGCT